MNKTKYDFAHFRQLSTRPRRAGVTRAVRTGSIAKFHQNLCKFHQNPGEILVKFHQFGILVKFATVDIQPGIAFTCTGQARKCICARSMINRAR